MLTSIRQVGKYPKVAVWVQLWDLQVVTPTLRACVSACVQRESSNEIGSFYLWFSLPHFLRVRPSLIFFFIMDLQSLIH